MAVAYIPGTLWAGGLASGHGGTLGIIDILDIIILMTIASFQVSFHS